MPVKLNAANVLSPQGAERKRPAGDRACRHADVKAICFFVAFEDGTSSKVR